MSEGPKSRHLQIALGLVPGAVLCVAIFFVWWRKDDISIILGVTIVSTIYACLAVYGIRVIASRCRGEFRQTEPMPHDSALKRHLSFTLKALFVVVMVAIALLAWVTLERRPEPTDNQVSAQQSSGGEATRPIDPERDRMEAAAIAEVVRQTSLESTGLKASAKKDGDDWRVVVLQLPPIIPGGFYFLLISQTGEVKEYIPGK